jgi:2-dehydropantoate 2-reductase
MRIAIVGAGGIGAPLGASLANFGHDVVFVARGAHLAAMQENGLRIEGDRGMTHVEAVQATDDPKTVGAADIILSCVKLWDLESSADLMRPMIRHDTMVIPLQNGVDSSESLSSLIGAEHVLGGVAMVTGSIVRPGVVRQTGKHHSIIFGELNGEVSSRVSAFRDAAKAAGIDAVVPDNIQIARWNKFIGLAALAGICSLMRQPLGPLREDPDIAPVIQTAMQEIVDVGIASGIPLGPTFLDNWVNLLHSLPAELTPSMLVDLKAGKRLELRWLTGKVVELGRAHGVSTPVNSVIYAALKPYADGQAL